MALRISVQSSDCETPPLVFDMPLLIIGRGSSSDLRLPDPSVSHRHASIRQRGSDHLLLDEGSVNGTFVGSARLPAGAPRLLQDGDLVRVGRVWLEINTQSAENPSSSDETRELALRLVSGALGAEGGPNVPVARIVDGPGKGDELVLEQFQHPYVVGRSPKCDLVLQDDDLSRRHFEIRRVGSDIVVSDLGSKNGTRIADKTITGEARWKPGQLLEAGNSRLELIDPLERTLEEINSAADEVISSPPQAPVSDMDDGEPGDHAPGARGPVAARPKKSRKKPEIEPTASWGAVDVVVALVALSVLGASVVGILWLMRG